MNDDITLVGGGLVGSLLALMLAKNGNQVKLFESRQDLRKHDISAGRSINLALANRGIKPLKQMGLMPEIEKLIIPMRGRMVHLEDGSQQLQPYGTSDKDVIYSISRGDLNKLLLDKAEETGLVDCVFEQPLKAGEDELLRSINCPFPLGADESFHISEDIPRLAQIYDVINIKLDKCGGLTEAINIINKAKEYQLDIMVGCMVGTSLSMAPGLIIATQAKFVDLDAPLLISRDREFGLNIDNGVIKELDPRLWGS